MGRRHPMRTMHPVRGAHISAWVGAALLAAATALPAQTTGETEAEATPRDQAAGAAAMNVELPDLDVGPAAREAASTITSEDLEQRIGVLADDSMRGRDTPSPELEEVARYIAAQFESFGLQPGADGDYLQSYPLTRVTPGESESQRVVLRGPGGTHALEPGAEFVSAPTAGPAAGSGELVPVSSLEEVERAAGEIALLVVTPEELQGSFGGLGEAVQRHQPAGVLVALDAPPQFYQGVRSFFSGGGLTLGAPSETPPVMLLPRSSLPDALTRALAAGGGLEGWTAEVRADYEVESLEAMNTIGWIEGSDPELRDEYVIFTAHMDHVGVGRAVPDTVEYADGSIRVEMDSIFNGADDDASGTATIIELAQAFAELPEPPRRSVVFMTVSGEEKGLLGSRWYSEHPTFPLDQTVADFNIDMIGRNWRDTVVAIGKRQSSLGPLVEAVSAAHPDLEMAVVDDRWPEENFYFRSDHYNFARKGVPILFFFSGVHEDYHRPSDEPALIRYDKAARIGRLIFYTGLAVADADEPPVWDPRAYLEVVETPGG